MAPELHLRLTCSAGARRRWRRLARKFSHTKRRRRVGVDLAPATIILRRRNSRATLSRVRFLRRLYLLLRDNFILLARATFAPGFGASACGARPRRVARHLPDAAGGTCGGAKGQAAAAKVGRTRLDSPALAPTVRRPLDSTPPFASHTHFAGAASFGAAGTRTGRPIINEIMRVGRLHESCAFRSAEQRPSCVRNHVPAESMLTPRRQRRVAPLRPTHTHTHTHTPARLMSQAARDVSILRRAQKTGSPAASPPPRRRPPGWAGGASSNWAERRNLFVCCWTGETTRGAPLCLAQRGFSGAKRRAAQRRSCCDARQATDSERRARKSLLQVSRRRRRRRTRCTCAQLVVASLSLSSRKFVQVYSHAAKLKRRKLLPF